MGKRVKKARAGPKGKQAPTSSSRALKKDNNHASEIVDDGAVMEKEKEQEKKEKRACVHFEKAIDLAKVCSKLDSAECAGCEDCREGMANRKGGKGKGKHGKNKGVSDSKATWICLQCGHHSCGGIGLPSNPQYHAVRHSRQTKHPLVIQVENPHLRWCFTCSTLISVDKLDENGEQVDVLSDIVKRLKKQSSKASSVDVEDIWFGSGSVVSDYKLEKKVVNGSSGNDFYAVRGLVNLGNTCFFNSVMQNLLAMDILREYLLKFDGSMGPLTSALKKVYVETSPESGLRTVINPRSLFGCICAKAPQFRGYQQQDSHELLRCLLDGLSTEDASLKKSANSSLENGTSLPASPTFIDSLFGGQISSAVCCVECGHSSVVSEPFLDLSLPVPTKKPPPKKTQLASRTRKPKLPPKRVNGTRPKLNRDADSLTIVSGCNPSSSSASSSCFIGPLINNSSSVDLVEPVNVIDPEGSVAQDPISTQPGNTTGQVSQSSGEAFDASSWLDFLGPVTLVTDTSLDNCVPVSVSADQNSAEETKNLLVTLDSQNMEVNCCAVSAPDTGSGGEIGVQTDKIDVKPLEMVDDREDAHPPLVQDNVVLLLPYKENDTTTVEDKKQITHVSSVDGGDEEDTEGFGFGDLFDEPEPTTMPSAVPNDVQAAAQLRNGFVAGNSTESESDEVDNTDAPVSVEGCLAHFVKPELLSGEHAWHCENCSKLQQKKKLKLKKNLLKPAQLLHKHTSKYECSSSEVLQGHPSEYPSLVIHSNGSSEPHQKRTHTMLNGTGVFPKENGEIYEPEDESSCTSSVSVIPKLSDEATSAVNSVNFDASCADHIPIEEPSGSEEHESVEDENDEEINSKCVKVLRNATKRMLVSRIPPILTIHLKRFGHDTRGRLNKLNGHVVFKEFIDLRPYMDDSSTEVDNCVYRLVGVVEHSGSMRGGHYIAYVRGGDKHRFRSEEDDQRQRRSVWYYASDAHVREAPLEEVLRSEAYILFYEKVQT